MLFSYVFSMDTKNSFQGRSFTVASDLSLDEWVYIFEKTKELEEAMSSDDKGSLSRFRIDDEDYGVYTVFLENSTRTDHSFQNASKFHGVRWGQFNPATSSRKKSESYADTFNTLTGYGNIMFVVRSEEEGLCRWLEINGKKYAERNGLLVPPSFINAGDGKHEHPTQELLDEYTFWRAKSGDRSHMHIALIGDLMHGRTIHSKVDGLRLYQEVEVDLVAPEELAMPDHYIERMTALGFNVRTFGSLDEYYAQTHIAAEQYFTRLQLERMGDDIQRRSDELRSKVRLRKDHLEKIPGGAKLRHPLPRYKEDPTIPTFVNDTPFNGYEIQSRNGYLTRIILQACIAGKIGADFDGKTIEVNTYPDDFIEMVSPTGHANKEYKEGIRPISDGMVIDHICRGDNPREIWAHLARVMDVMDLYGRGWMGVDESKHQPGVYKGLISLPDCSFFDKKIVNKLGSVAPGSTLNLIEGASIVEKLRLNMPRRVYGFREISCKNDSCVSYPAKHEGVPSEFIRNDKDDSFVCKYCETPHTFKEMWG